MALDPMGLLGSGLWWPADATFVVKIPPTLVGELFAIKQGFSESGRAFVC
jgi:hypothetical protein